MNTDHRFIVIGCGGLGSAALYWLARTGAGAVLGLERHELGHVRGASQDHSRIIRYAQHQDAYAALAPAAYEAWHEVEHESAQRLIVETGGLVIEDVEARAGLDTGTRNIDGYAATARRHDVPVEVLDAAALTARWPQFRLAGSERAMFQARSGIVDAARANATHVALARAHGAEVREHAAVRALHPVGGHVEVVTDDETYRAEHVVVTAGARTNEVLAGVRELPLVVTDEQVTHHATPHLLDFSPERFPVFTWHGADTVDGFGVHGDVATKLVQHRPDATGPAASAAPAPDDGSDPLGRERRLAFLAEHVPGFGGPELSSTTHRHATLPDHHLVLDTVPEAARISVGVGAADAPGFASLLGHVLADLATSGRTRHAIDAFSLDRSALLGAAPVSQV